jgi:uncharacterized membrane protein YdjX (TVP38/TMEM64 family)
MGTQDPSPAAGQRIPPRLIALGAFLVVSLAAFAVAFFEGWLRPGTIHSTVAGAGAWAMLGYIAAVAIGEILWMPRMWGLLAGGMLFGPWAGGALALVADMISAMVCYGIARGAGRTWVQQRLGQRPAAQRVVDLLAKRRGGVTVAVLRVCPVAHYTLVSYAAGLAGVSTRGFVLGTAVGILPGAILYPIVGDSMLRPTSPVFIGSMAILLVFLIATGAAGRRALKG